MANDDKQLDIAKYRKLGLLGGIVLAVLLSVFFIADYFGWPRPVLRRYAQDTVVIGTTNNAPGTEVGILIDGLFQKDAQASPVFKNDEAFVGKGVQIPVGHVLKATGADSAGKTRTNEVIAFTAARPMVIQENVGWSQKYDDVKVTFSGKPLSLPITVWVMHDRDGDGKITAETKSLAAAVVQANATWKQQKVGLMLVAAVGDFKDALPAKNPQAAGYAKFDCGATTAAKTAKIKALKKDIGHVSGRINVYIADEVKVGTTFAKYHGQACLVGSDVTVLGSMGQLTLLTHEIGHSLNLFHPPASWMKSTDRVNENKAKNKLSIYNVMVPNAGSHKYFTEGQIFRAHVQKASAVNDIYTERAALGASQGYPLRNTCTLAAAGYTCPQLDKRIWANGSFYPPN